MLTKEKRESLECEWKELQEKLKSEFPSPKDYNRQKVVTSLLMTDGKSGAIDFNFLKGKESKRVTSFTKNRR